MSKRISPKVPLGTAQTLSKHLKAALDPFCERSMIVGSVRRTAALVGDIELVVMAAEAQVANLFGENVYAARTRLDVAVESPDMERIHSWVFQSRGSGRSIKRLDHKFAEITAEIYVVHDVRAWGINVAVRTGPAAYSKYLMSRARELGFCFKDGFLLHGHPADGLCAGAACGEIIPMYHESDVFEVLKMPYMTPQTRGEIYGDHA